MLIILESKNRIINLNNFDELTITKEKHEKQNIIISAKRYEVEQALKPKINNILQTPVQLTTKIIVWTFKNENENKAIELYNQIKQAWKNGEKHFTIK